MRRIYFIILSIVLIALMGCAHLNSIMFNAGPSQEQLESIKQSLVVINIKMEYFTNDPTNLKTEEWTAIGFHVDSNKIIALTHATIPANQIEMRYPIFGSIFMPNIRSSCSHKSSHKSS